MHLISFFSKFFRSFCTYFNTFLQNYCPKKCHILLIWALQIVGHMLSSLPWCVLPSSFSPPPCQCSQPGTVQASPSLLLHSGGPSPPLQAQHLRADAFPFVRSWPFQSANPALLREMQFLAHRECYSCSSRVCNLIPVASHWPCLLNRIWICLCFTCPPFSGWSSQSGSQRFRGSWCRNLTEIRVYSKLLLPAFPPSHMETVTESVLTYAHAICEIS